MVYILQNEMASLKYDLVECASINLHIAVLISFSDSPKRLLRSFTGWVVPDVCQVIISRWGSDPYVCGSYTFVPQGVLAEEHEALAAPLPSEPISDNSKVVLTINMN